MGFSSQEETHDSNVPTNTSSRTCITGNHVLYRISSKETIQSYQGSISNSSVHTTSPASTHEGPNSPSGQGPDRDFPIPDSDCKSSPSLEKLTFGLGNQSSSTVCTIREPESDRSSIEPSTPKQDAPSMYPQPLQHQQTWSSAQFPQAEPLPLSTWPSAPVIHTAQNGHATAGPHPASHHSFVPPAPPGVNPQQWQNGRWIYAALPRGVSNAQPQGPYPPPNLVGWNVPAGWGIAPQYYHPPQSQAEPSYWDTKLTDDGLGLENMHIKQPVAHTTPGAKDETPHTPWAWVPRELDDESPPPSISSSQYRSAFQFQQPSPVEPTGRQNSTTASAAPPSGGSTGYAEPGQAGLPPHAYFSVPTDQQQQQHQQPSANTGSGSRPILPPATTYSAHIRQRSNPQQTATATHHQPAAGSQPTTSTLPSQPTPSAQSLQRSHGIAGPTPQRPGRTESYTSVKQLRPTFSPAIVRTPNHYRHDPQPVVPSPRVAPWDDANPNSAGMSTSVNKHLSGAMQSMVPSPLVLPWNAHANDDNSPTPAPRHARSSRTEPSRMHATSSRSDPGFSLPPPQQPKPPWGTYRQAVRYGFWNRRGDYLTMDKFVVYAPPNRANPPELEGYPSPTEGYKDHYGNFVKYSTLRMELPESLPRLGLPPVLPYEKFVTYVYM